MHESLHIVISGGLQVERIRGTSVIANREIGVPGRGGGLPSVRDEEGFFAALRMTACAVKLG
jgi:hypothetical protein